MSVALLINFQMKTKVKFKLNQRMKAQKNKLNNNVLLLDPQQVQPYEDPEWECGIWLKILGSTKGKAY